MQNKTFLKTVSIIVVLAFSWSNVVWAEGVQPIRAAKLAAPSQAGVLGRAVQTDLEVLQLVQELVRRRIDSMDELKSWGISVGILGDKKCLISKDVNAPSKEAYYFFTKDKPVYYRVTTARDVRDNISLLLEKLGVSVQSEVVDVKIGRNSYFQQKYSINTEQQPLIVSFLRIIYEGDATVIGAKVKTPALPVTTSGENGFTTIQALVSLVGLAVAGIGIYFSGPYLSMLFEAFLGLSIIIKIGIFAVFIGVLFAIGFYLWYRFTYVEKDDAATLDELVVLLDSPNQVIRSIAFKILLSKRSAGLKFWIGLFLKNQNDDVKYLIFKHLAKESIITSLNKLKSVKEHEVLNAEETLKRIGFIFVDQKPIKDFYFKWGISRFDMVEVKGVLKQSKTGEKTVYVILPRDLSKILDNQKIHADIPKTTNGASTREREIIFPAFPWRAPSPVIWYIWRIRSAIKRNKDEFHIVYPPAITESGIFRDVQKVWPGAEIIDIKMKDEAGKEIEPIVHFAYFRPKAVKKILELVKKLSEFDDEVVLNELESLLEIPNREIRTTVLQILLEKKPEDQKFWLKFLSKAEYDDVKYLIFKHLNLGIIIRLIEGSESENEMDVVNARSELERIGFQIVNEKPAKGVYFKWEMSVFGGITVIDRDRPILGLPEIVLGMKVQPVLGFEKKLIRGKTGEKTVYIILPEDLSKILKTQQPPAKKPAGKHDTQSQQYNRVVRDEKEVKLMTMPVDFNGQISATRYRNDSGPAVETVSAPATTATAGRDFAVSVRDNSAQSWNKLAEILGVSVNDVPSAVQKKLQDILDTLKKNPEYGTGIFGAVKEIILVDNLGGLDSKVASSKKGGVAILQNGIVLIDIDAFRNDAVLVDVVTHELWHSILELVETNPGICEVTAIYESLKDFTSVPESEELALVAFLNSSDNGLDSIEYAKLLQHVVDNNVNGDQLITLAISYVLNTARYGHLSENLKSVVSSDIQEAEQKLDLAMNVYTDLINATKAVEPIIKKVKTSESKSKTIMKFKMLISNMPAREVGFVEALVKANKYIRLYVEDLQENPYIVEWLKEITLGKEKTPFIFSSKTDADVSQFLSKNNLKQAQVPANIERKNVIDARDIAFAVKEGLAQDSLSMPIVYSKSGIYLAGQVVLADGLVGEIKGKDPLAYNTLMSMYKALFGDDFTEEMLTQLIFGTLPKIAPLTETIDALRRAIAQVEVAA